MEKNIGVFETRIYLEDGGCMLVSKIYEEDPVFKNADDAIRYMHKTKFKYEVAVYDINTDKAYEKKQRKSMQPLKSITKEKN